MIREEQGCAVIHCDRCPARLDLGPAAQFARRRRLPTGWLDLGSGRHQCSLHPLPAPKRPL